MNGTHGSLAGLLKQRTADVHDRVETTLGLVDPGLDRARLRDVVVTLHAFWQGTEPQLDAWTARTSAADADLVAALDWPRRRRGPRLTRDLAALATGAPTPVRPTVPAPPVFNRVDAAALLGWLYVTEGSSLGGAAISRRLADFDPPLVLEFFAPYAEGPAPMWRAYHQLAADWVGADDLRRERVADAARTTFTALADLVAPLARESVA